MLTVYLIDMFTKKFEKMLPRTIVRSGADLMAKLTVLRSPSVTEPLFVQKTKPAYATETSVSYVTDVSLIFNQQRLDRMTLQQLSQRLEQLPPSSPLSQVRKKMTDEQLHQFVKSRYCQSMSELQAWSKYLDINFQSEIESLNTDLKSEEIAPTTESVSTGASSE